MTSIYPKIAVLLFDGFVSWILTRDRAEEACFKSCHVFQKSRQIVVVLHAGPDLSASGVLFQILPPEISDQIFHQFFDGIFLN